MITPAQLRMARAAIDCSLGRLAIVVNIHEQQLYDYEHGNQDALSLGEVSRLRLYFTAHRIFFGPHHSISLNEDVYENERWLSIALIQLLKEWGRTPSSKELLNAYERARRESADNLNP